MAGKVHGKRPPHEIFKFKTLEISKSQNTAEAIVITRLRCWPHYIRYLGAKKTPKIALHRDHQAKMSEVMRSQDPSISWISKCHNRRLGRKRLLLA